MKSLNVLAALLCFVSAFASGCCTMQPYGPCGGSGPGGQLLGVSGVAGDCGSCDSCSSGHSCTSGCGDVYYDERINTPPVCDPCDSYSGTYTGPGCGPCGAQLPILHRIGRLFAIGYNPACGGCGMDSCGSCDGGCSSCDGGGCSSCGGGEEMHYGPMESNQNLMVVPKKDDAPAAVPAPIPDSNASRSRTSRTPTRQASATSSRISPAQQKRTGTR